MADIGIGVGTLAVLSDRNNAHNVPYDQNEPLSEQNAWSFGQIVPVVLLLLPFLALVEVSYGEWRAVHLSKVLATHEQYKKRSRST